MLKKLKNLRSDAGITQDELSIILQIPKPTYAHYETGRSEPNIETLKKIADYFDVSLDYLCDRQNKNNLQLDSFTDAQKNLIEMIKPLSEKQVYSLIGYVTRMQEYPVEKILNQIKNS